ncbi:MAG TPA: PAS domain S-box protein [Planctomycetota bacterium]|nr:PAS domain S-box protein [Planctomycetota bacterium]HRR81207.1 PAS domain S-box protein [Planctomycetota bacterium]HRT97191.1 PAS domain S-box protein [Planctomycetota bacterium]
MIRVLLVEDNPGDARIVQHMLEAAERTVFIPHSVPTLAAAQEHLKRDGADVVLLDLELPDSAGLSTFSALQRAAPGTPVVVLTGLDDADAGLTAVRRGAHDYLVKGQVGADVLERSLRYAVARGRADEALRATAERLQALIHASPAAIVALDSEARVSLWSPAAERLFGWTESEVTGKRAPIVPEDDQEFAHLLYAPLRGQTIVGAEVRADRRDGPPLDVSLSVAPIRDAENNTAGIMGVLLDLSERKRLEAEVVEIAEEERRRLGRDLHDSLGQHLTGILYAMAALGNRLASAGHPEADAVANAVSLLEKAVAEVRTLSRGLCPSLGGPGDLARAIDSFAATVHMLHGIACRSQCDPEMTVGDDLAATHLYRIVQEAVTNAIRHGRATEVMIRLFSRGTRGLLSVEDNGSGIPDDWHQRSGLGLRIMTYRARMLGGTLRIARAPGGGTLVSCQFPLTHPRSTGDASHEHA